MVFNTLINSEESTAIALQKKVLEIENVLKNQLDSDYTITNKEINTGNLEKNWSHDIKIEKCNKVGAIINFKWEKETQKNLEITLDDYSKIGSIIGYSTSVPLVIIGLYMGYNNIAPLNFLPGKKIAAFLGAIIAFIVALIIAAILRIVIFTKAEKDQTENLILKIKNILDEKKS